MNTTFTQDRKISASIMYKYIIMMSILFLPLSLANAQYDPWVQVMKGIDLPNVNLELLSANEESVYTCDVFQGIFASSDNGNNWKYIGPVSLDSSTIYANIFATSLLTFDHTIIIGNAYNGLYVSDDDGSHWTQINLDPVKFLPSDEDLYPYHYPYVVQSLSKNEHYIFAATTHDGIYRSNDNGLTWSRTNYEGTENIMYMCTSGNIIYAGGEHFAFKSIDNGDSWSDLLSTPYLIQTLAVNNQGILFAGMYSVGLIKSTDNGVSWVKTNLPDMMVPIIKFYNNNMIISAYGKFKNSGWDEEGILLSSNNGDSWRKIGIDGLTYPTSILIKDDYIFAISNIVDSVINGNKYTHDAIFRAKITDLITGIQDDAPSSEISIYPNPASDYIYINSPLLEGAGGMYEYTIFDLLGQNLQRSVLNDSKIDISKIPIGVYCIVFSNSGKQIIQKFIKY